MAQTKKNQVQPLHVKNPTIGEEYYFKFAGSISKGTLLSEERKLSQYYGVKWYMLEDNTGTKYPVSIHWLATDPKQIRYV